MTLAIILLMLFGCLLIATGHLTNINKSAVAIFMGTVGWMVYICYGTDFVMSEHPADYAMYLCGEDPTSEAVKYFICDNIFVKYLAKASAIVMFFFATMTIVEILNNNGCFDFITEWIKTRNSRRLLWTITFATFALSANLDNLTTTTMMLIIMHNIVQSRKQRMIIGSAIVLASNCGGCMTVIGDAAGLILWEDGRIGASDFFLDLFLPSFAAWIIATWLLGRKLPERLDVEWPVMPYRGNDTRLNRWQRFAMLVIGIGGLWFIPTFHNITKLSPFLGALCVLSILWIVNEMFNRKLLKADQMTQSRTHRALQYGTLQQMLFILGAMLAVGVVAETGITKLFYGIIIDFKGLTAISLVSGVLSSFIDSFAVFVTDFTILPKIGTTEVGVIADKYMYWKTIAYSTAVGGCLLSIGTSSGLALMKIERMRVGWYFKNCTPCVLIGWLAGTAVLIAECYFWR